MVFIRRKRKGNTFYYELVESHWEDGKSVQRIIEYFPTLEAANLFCEKKGIRKLETKNVIAPSLESRISEKLAKLNSLRPLSETALRKLQEKFEVDMTYNSNAIEGNRLTLRETWLVLRKGVTISGKSLEEHLEAKNHLEALKHLFDLVKSESKLGEEDILELHRMVLSKVDESIAGKYRTMQVYIEGAVHLPPPASKVPKLMKTILEEINRKTAGVAAIKSASKVHHLITWVHPFTDGNGRMARLLLNLKLMRSRFPPIVLKKEKRKSYYSALEMADDGDLYPITMLIAGEVESSLDIWLGAVG